MEESLTGIQVLRTARRGISLYGVYSPRYWCFFLSKETIKVVSKLSIRKLLSSANMYSQILKLLLRIVQAYFRVICTE